MPSWTGVDDVVAANDVEEMDESEGDEGGAKGGDDAKGAVGSLGLVMVSCETAMRGMRKTRGRGGIRSGNDAAFDDTSVDIRSISWLDILVSLSVLVVVDRQWLVVGVWMCVEHCVAACTT